MLLEYLAVYTIGALGYGGLELLWRGHTHWSMLLTGGLCFLCLYLIGNHSRSLPFWKNCLMGTAVITTIEYFTGLLVNLTLGWQVWDYSAERLHLLGQICPQFCLLWFLLCIPLLPLCRLMKRILC